MKARTEVNKFPLWEFIYNKITQGQFCLCQFLSISSCIHCHSSFICHQKSASPVQIEAELCGQNICPYGLMFSCSLGSFHASQYCLEVLSMPSSVLRCTKVIKDNEKTRLFLHGSCSRRTDPQTSHRKKCVIELVVDISSTECWRSEKEDIILA